jgi:LacI family transcriptional regulator
VVADRADVAVGSARGEVLPEAGAASKGTLLPDSAVTLKDVARRAGVHPATASRALNPETRLLVSEETANRVLAAATALGYRPNAVARSLRTRRSHTIGVLIPDLNNPLFPPIVRGLADRLELHGYVALIGNTDGDEARERRVYEQLRARHVDGYVLATARLRDPLLEDAARSGAPVVLMNRIAADDSFPSVTVDNEAGVRLVVDHLVALGHRNIACIAGPQDVSTGLARYRAFRTAMTDAGLPVPDSRVRFARAFSIEEGLRCAREILATDDGCTAVAASNDMLAVGCYLALDDAGLTCPADISVVGFNDMPFIDMLRPPLTTVAFSHDQVGAHAADLLIERLNGGSGPAKVIYVVPRLVVRGSTGRRS